MFSPESVDKDEFPILVLIFIKSLFLEESQYPTGGDMAHISPVCTFSAQVEKKIKRKG